MVFARFDSRLILTGPPLKSFYEKDEKVSVVGYKPNPWVSNPKLKNRVVYLA
jgi:hypothetical protein